MKKLVLFAAFGLFMFSFTTSISAQNKDTKKSETQAIKEVEKAKPAPVAEKAQTAAPTEKQMNKEEKKAMKEEKKAMKEEKKAMKEEKKAMKEEKKAMKEEKKAGEHHSVDHNAKHEADKAAEPMGAKTKEVKKDAPMPKKGN
jgi:hypothetical protein